ncbi:hypothetical protein [Nesterenkonia jeotgali]|uniref:Uncharacterized protein n=1 Tax=Nesterenkonia jeotgali TaxID=317018 RepID=A0A0W8IGG8_9MICC|nr:hypothetical protein [Nesterenkonia jeotgali]KUG58963.1 hypothetical protein AVL63_02770 [Nesterenkonia jeotgali]
MSDITEQLEEERRIINAATAGPWEIKHLGYPGSYYTRTIHAEDSDLGRWSELPPEIASTAKDGDAEFIAHARTALPLRNAQVEAVLIELAVYEVPSKAADPTGAVAAGMERLEARIRRAIEEAGA